jgi:hypothetical protein
LPHGSELEFRSFQGTLLRYRSVLQYIGVVNDETEVPITVRCRDEGVFTVYAAFSAISSIAPFSLPHQIGRRAFEFIPENRMMHVHVQSGPAFTVRVKQDIVETLADNGGADIFVFDLRGKIDGDVSRDPGFFELLNWAQSPENMALMGNVYVIIGSNTMNAGTMYAIAAREFVSGATLIGSPAIGAPNTFWPRGLFALPNSGVQFSVAGTHLLLSPYSKTNTLYPDVFVRNYIGDYIDGFDAMLDYIMRRVSNN